MTISHVPSSKEVKSVMEQIDKQQITVGGYLQELILSKRKEEGKEPKNIREYMESQRQFVWENWRTSNLILTLILQGSVPEITLYRHDDKSQFRKTLDGQQRLTSMYLFINDMVKLDLSKSIFPVFEVEGEQYTYESIQGKTFSELSELFRDKIMTFDLRIVTYNNTTDEQAERYYVTMNAGAKVLKAAEIRTAAMGMTVRRFFAECLKSDWVFHTMTAKAAMSNAGNEIMAQVITLLYNKSAVELSKENIDKVIYSFRSDGVPENLRQDMVNICNYLNVVTATWIENKKKADEAQTVKRGKTITSYNTYRFSFFNKTHITMLMIAADKAIKNNVSPDIFADWAFTFFKDRPNEDYKNGSTSDTNCKVNEMQKVDMRILAIDAEINKLERQEVGTVVEQEVAGASDTEKLEWSSEGEVTPEQDGEDQRSAVVN